MLNDENLRFIKSLKDMCVSLDPTFYHQLFLQEKSLNSNFGLSFNQFIFDKFYNKNKSEDSIIDDELKEVYTRKILAAIKVKKNELLFSIINKKRVDSQIPIFPEYDEDEINEYLRTLGSIDLGIIWSNYSRPPIKKTNKSFMFQEGGLFDFFTKLMDIMMARHGRPIVLNEFVADKPFGEFISDYYAALNKSHQEVINKHLDKLHKKIEKGISDTERESTLKHIAAITASYLYNSKTINYKQAAINFYNSYYIDANSNYKIKIDDHQGTLNIALAKLSPLTEPPKNTAKLLTKIWKDENKFIQENLFEIFEVLGIDENDIAVNTVISGCQKIQKNSDVLDVVISKEMLEKIDSVVRTYYECVVESTGSNKSAFVHGLKSTINKIQEIDDNVINKERIKNICTRLSEFATSLSNLESVFDSLTNNQSNLANYYKNISQKLQNNLIIDFNKKIKENILKVDGNIDIANVPNHLLESYTQDEYFALLDFVANAVKQEQELVKSFEKNFASINNAQNAQQMPFLGNSRL